MTTNISIISSYNYYMKCYFVAIVCVFVCQFNCECVAVLFVLQLILMVQFEIFAPWNNLNGIAELEATSFLENSLSFICSISLYELSMCDMCCCCLSEACLYEFKL